MNGDGDVVGTDGGGRGLGGEYRVRLSGPLDWAAVARLRARLHRRPAEEAATVVVDLSRCAEADAAGAQALLAVARERAARGGRLLLHQPQPRLLLLMALVAGDGRRAPRPAA